MSVNEVVLDVPDASDNVSEMLFSPNFRSEIGTLRGSVPVPCKSKNI